MPFDSDMTKDFFGTPHFAGKESAQNSLFRANGTNSLIMLKTLCIIVGIKNIYCEKKHNYHEIRLSWNIV